MRKIGVVLVAGMMLVGCNQEAKRAETAYENASGPHDKCDMARKAQRAWLEAGDEDKYRDWQSTAAMDCLRASVAP